MISHQGNLTVLTDFASCLFAKPAFLSERFFSHPDYTVGSGIGLASPDQLTLADFTAGRELPPALKNFLFS